MTETPRVKPHGHDEPPTTWCDWWADLTRLTDDIYYGWPEDETSPWFWHWCSKLNQWRAAGTGAHELVAREPLHLEPSLLWPCCNIHGWVRSGAWTAA
jgi:hypothetical protein